MNVIFYTIAIFMSIIPGEYWYRKILIKSKMKEHLKRILIFCIICLLLTLGLEIVKIIQNKIIDINYIIKDFLEYVIIFMYLGSIWGYFRKYMQIIFKKIKWNMKYIIVSIIDKEGKEIYTEYSYIVWEKK